MSPGHADDVRLDAKKVAARLDVTPRHLARLVRRGAFPAPHYLRGLKRWWLSQIVAWEEGQTSTEAPAALRRGAANLLHGSAARVAQ